MHIRCYQGVGFTVCWWEAIWFPHLCLLCYAHVSDLLIVQCITNNFLLEHVPSVTSKLVMNMWCKNMILLHMGIKHCMTWLFTALYFLILFFKLLLNMGKESRENWMATPSCFTLASLDVSFALKNSMTGLQTSKFKRLTYICFACVALQVELLIWEIIKLIMEFTHSLIPFIMANLTKLSSWKT